jgi:hypothetical protein
LESTITKPKSAKHLFWSVAIDMQTRDAVK